MPQCTVPCAVWPPVAVGADIFALFTSGRLWVGIDCSRRLCSALVDICPTRWVRCCSGPQLASDKDASLRSALRYKIMLIVLVKILDSMYSSCIDLIHKRTDVTTKLFGAIWERASAHGFVDDAVPVQCRSVPFLVLGRHTCVVAASRPWRRSSP